MKIVVTGFEPFLEHGENPAREVIRHLPTSIKGNELIGVELPVLYDTCFEKLQAVIQEDVGLIVMVGLAGGRKGLHLERVAINVNDATAPDNNGTIYQDGIILENGKNAYFSTLPLRKIAAILQSKDIPVTISNSAGTYVCNNLMYHTLHYIEKQQLPIKAGFIHVPFMLEQTTEEGKHPLPLYTILEGVIDAIKASIT